MVLSPLSLSVYLNSDDRDDLKKNEPKNMMKPHVVVHACYLGEAMEDWEFKHKSWLHGKEASMRSYLNKKKKKQAKQFCISVSS